MTIRFYARNVAQYYGNEKNAGICYFSYGYELMDNLKNGNFLETKPDAGVVYRILRKLEKEGFVKSTGRVG
ncbi:MAG: hypothetical protein COY53_08470 [Elusimicrobia bacterium CG_4_10_14_0_8_um_filter_37_32]|nr:MAG: hypothetical protein COS17_09965 [Elusimicrobia bacterium CG02_land_8_20_14_3_00_37_13]PIZ12738.1 MAG: hypothetical protein COY53_08470 [Elusimicrobia bacterium CG_4_10_14_0_8_um_filter_37_32]